MIQQNYFSDLYLQFKFLDTSAKIILFMQNRDINSFWANVKIKICSPIKYIYENYWTIWTTPNYEF